MSSTATASLSATITEAQVRAVMQKVRTTFAALAVLGLITQDQATKWATDLTYLQLERAIEFFEIQLDGRRYGLRFTIFDDGSIQQDSKSGGLDFHGVPKGTKANLYAHTRANLPQRIWDELARRGWGTNGRRLEAATSERRAFSNDGYGIVREKLGEWPQ
jgi:Bacterial HORMA domain family 1